VSLAAGGLILVQRLVPTAVRRQHNDVAGFIYAVLGVVYAVLLGLTVVAVWEEWNAGVELEFPFGGGLRIGPEAMEQVLSRFESSKLSDL